MTKKLREISSRRENISFDYDRKLVKNLSEYILELSTDYDVYEVFFYSTILQSERVILIYPLNSSRESYTMNIKSEEKVLHLSTVFLNLAQNNSIDFYKEIRRFCDFVSHLL